MSKKTTKADAASLSTGCTVLNLACTGTTFGGIPKGTFAYLVGDSSTRKTWIGHTALAEACLSPDFEDHALVYFDVEHGVRMDVRQYFGKLAERIVYEHPDSLESFYDRVDAALEHGPCILVLDSMDGLVPEAEVEQTRKERKARERGREVSGSYKTDKARINSARLRVVVNSLKKTGSILIVISQTRQNIGYGAQFNPKTRSGGDALKFYARLEFWMSVKEKIRKKVGDKERVVGHKIRFKCTKNHVSGNEGNAVDVTFYRNTGLDDTGTCVDYLCDEYWKSTKEKVTAPEFDYDGSREGLVQMIEAGGREKELRMLVSEVWADIEAGCAVERKRRYE